MRDDVQGVPGDERKQDIVSTSGAIPTWRTVWGRGCNLQEAKFPSPRGKSYVARALAQGELREVWSTVGGTPSYERPIPH
jgi:hypothetical protein